MSEETEYVRVSRDGAVATVLLNRPDRHNSVHRPLKTALYDALAGVAEDESVRAVLLTGAGKSFCVGQDLGEHAEALRADPSTALDTVAEHYNPIVESLTGMPKPVVAAINGNCVGAGLGLALACDIRVASANAKFGAAFTGIGLACDSGLTASLARAIGQAKASELILLGDTFTAEQAHSWGLLRAVVAPDELAAAGFELAERLAAGPTLAYAAVKRGMAEAWQRSTPEVLAAEYAAQRELGTSKDHAAAVEAFLNKRTPTFDGR